MGSLFIGLRSVEDLCRLDSLHGEVRTEAGQSLPVTQRLSVRSWDWLRGEGYQLQRTCSNTYTRVTLFVLPAGGGDLEGDSD
jgi:hypothetical protein